MSSSSVFSLRATIGGAQADPDFGPAPPGAPGMEAQLHAKPTLLLFPYTIHPVLTVCCILGYFGLLFPHMSAYNAMVTKSYFHLFPFHFSFGI